MADLISPTEIFNTTFEPKLSNRFIMYIEGIPPFLIKSADRPSLQFNNIEMHHINLVWNVKGKGIWQPVNITMYDPVVPSAAQAAMEWVRLSHESVSGRDGYTDFYKKDITFNVLGPVGDKIEEWTLKGAYVTSVTFGQMGYDNDAPVEIQITLQPDLCVLQY